MSGDILPPTDQISELQPIKKQEMKWQINRYLLVYQNQSILYCMCVVKLYSCISESDRKAECRFRSRSVWRMMRVDVYPVVMQEHHTVHTRYWSDSIESSSHSATQTCKNCTILICQHHNIACTSSSLRSFHGHPENGVQKVGTLQSFTSFGSFTVALLTER